MPVVQTMSQQARITVTSGPSRGQVYEVDAEEEVTYIGSEPDEHGIALQAPDLSGHLASIMHRGGRYAISTPLDDLLQVDESVIPADCWVWLPEQARVKVGRHTAFRFDGPGGSTGSGLPLPESETNGRDSARHASRKAARVKRPGSRRTVRPLPSGGDSPPAGSETQSAGSANAAGSTRRVARFITDRPGETLVRLGEDGQLPELKLSEGSSRTTEDASQGQNSPMVLYAVLGLSLVMSLGMLLLDAGSQSGATQRRERARMLITRYYGTEEDNLEPWQLLLRDARLAHSRGDRNAEQSAYRQVLEMLSSEDAERSLNGLTGARSIDEDRDLDDPYYNENQGRNDRELRRLISALMTR